jgi:hypothetical protein
MRQSVDTVYAEDEKPPTVMIVGTLCGWAVESR